MIIVSTLISHKVYVYNPFPKRDLANVHRFPNFPIHGATQQIQKEQDSPAALEAF
jgi:hypothetical protein